MIPYLYILKTIFQLQGWIQFPTKQRMRREDRRRVLSTSNGDTLKLSLNWVMEVDKTVQRHQKHDYKSNAALKLSNWAITMRNVWRVIDVTEFMWRSGRLAARGHPSKRGEQRVFMESRWYIADSRALRRNFIVSCVLHERLMNIQKNQIECVI